MATKKFTESGFHRMMTTFQPECQHAPVRWVRPIDPKYLERAYFSGKLPMNYIVYVEKKKQNDQNIHMNKKMKCK